MSLTRKTFLIIFTTVSILTVTATYLLFEIIESRFLKLEHDDAVTNMHRAEKALMDEIHQLSIKEQDWSSWDDTYDFMNTKSNEYIDSNLGEEALENLKTTDIIYIKNDGSLFYSLQKDKLKKDFTGIEFIEYAKTKDLYKETIDGDPHNGVIKLGDKAIIFSSEPILTTQRNGPSRGALYYIKVADEHLNKKLSSETELTLNYINVDKVDNRILNILVSTNKPYFELIDQTKLVAYGLINDPWNKPVLISKVELPRSLYLQGLATKNIMLTTLYAISLIMTLVMLALLHWQVIKRLNNLSSEVSTISTNRDTSYQLSVAGKDEITSVTNGINHMLKQIHSYELEIKQARDLAESASLARAQFIANVSHEIRTPMNGILGMTEVLLRIDKDKEHNKYVKMIRTSAKTLLEVINDILDFSKIDAGKLELEKINFSLNKLCQEALNAIAFNAQVKGLEVLCSIDTKLYSEYLGDPLRLRQVLINLLGNAVKFTSSGSITLKVSESNNSNILFEVVDTGIGIPKDRQDKVFDSFIQADGSTTRNFGGTGLGLTISKEIVKAMGGNLSITSEINNGSNFFFEIKLDANSDSCPNFTESKKNVCIVSSNKFLTRWLNENLSQFKVNNVIEHQSINELNYDNNYDTYILDADSLDINHINNFIHAQTNKSRIITLLSSAKGELEVDISKNNNSIVLLKPILSSDLYKVIMSNNFDNLVDNRNEDLEPLQTTNQPLNILLVDDVSMNLDVLRLLLKPLGHNLYFASNGQEAIDTYLNKNSELDIIIMDEQMPIMNGIEATKIIRELEDKDKVINRIPIIGCSANVHASANKRLLDSGMNDVVGKPITGKIVVEKILKNTGKLAVDNHTITNSNNNDQILDIEDLLSRYNNDQSIVIELLDLFEEDQAEFLDKISESVKLEDTVELKRWLHSFKGIILNISAFKAANRIKDFENNLDTLSREEMSSYYNSLNLEISQLNSIIKEFKSKKDIELTNSSSL